MANVRRGAIQFPPALKSYCLANDWTLFRVTMATEDRLDLSPVLPGDNSELAEEYHSSLSPDGLLWIPAALRAMVLLGEQSVMMRVEGETVVVYLRKVFKTLGFGP